MEIKNLKKRSEQKSESVVEDYLRAEFNRFGLYPVQQLQIGKYRVDFAFPEKMLVIEVDGWMWHKGRLAEDAIRDEELKSLGWTVKRFMAKDVMNQSDEIVLSILNSKPFESRAQFRPDASEEDQDNEEMDEGSIYDIEEKKRQQEEQKILEDEQVFDAITKTVPMRSVASILVSEPKQ